MRTFLGRKNRHGQWVAAGPHSELLAAVALEEEVLIELPGRSVVTKLVKVGQAFPWAGGEPPWAFGYPATEIPALPPRNRPLRHRSRRVVAARPALTPVAAPPTPDPDPAPTSEPEVLLW